MRILIVCSKNSGHIAPFILEQAQALERAGVVLEFFTIEGKGILGYLKNRKALLNKIKTFQPDLIHAHYGLSGLLANTQRKVPVVTTYHGSDINIPSIFFLLRLNMILSKHNIFVSEKHRIKSHLRNKFSVMPCGVDTNLFLPMDKKPAKEILGLDIEKKYVLFAGAFKVKVKNPELAKLAITLVPNVELIELSGFIREQVAVLLNAVDVVLMTSFTEGSPQIIKEALACNCPVVSVPVGDVPYMIKNINGCYISSYDPDDVAAKLKLAMSFGKCSDSRNRIFEYGLDGETVANKILEVYRNVMK